MSDMLTDEQLAGMRAFAALPLPDEAFIWREDMVADDMGSKRPSDPQSEMPGYVRVNAADQPVRARLDPLGAREAAIAARYSTARSWAIVLPALTDIQPSDRAVVAGRLLEVLPADTPPSWEIVRRVIASEVAP